MIKITNLNIPAAAGLSGLAAAASRALGVSEGDIISAAPLRVSVDARKKRDVCFVCAAALEVKNEDRILSLGLPGVTVYAPVKWELPYKSASLRSRPVVCGMGPAGLFAALMLAEAGCPPIILERGRDVDTRADDVRRYWATGVVDPVSNVQFGEGGAGTFSDGKLTTGVNDVRIPYVLERFIGFGAPEDIGYLAKPHIGTDMLREVVKNIRGRLVGLGCDVRFENRLCGVSIENGALCGVSVSSPEGAYEIETDALILAPGNSARDTFHMLAGAGVPFEAKPFAVGVRIEHLQREVDAAQYGEAASLGTLPASDYKLAVHLPGGRSVFTFCVCPGGAVVAAASEDGSLVTNGMSEHARAGENINGGLLVGVSPDDFNGVFGGVELQNMLEKRAFEAGRGRAPAQLVGDFLKKRPSESLGRVKPTYLPGVTLCSLWDVLPAFICEAIAAALPELDKRVRGFASPDAVLTAVETRSSCPVRIPRDKSMQAGVRGIFPCGEGGGWAGGIMSSAVDGIRCAEALLGRDA